MAITLLNSGSLGVTPFTAVPVTVSFDAGTGDDKLLIVSVLGSGATAAAANSSVTYGGTSMTPIVSQSIIGAGAAVLKMFYLLDTDISAGSNNVVITFGGSTGEDIIQIASYANVSQSAPDDFDNAFPGFGVTSETNTLTSVNSGSLVISSLATNPQVNITQDFSEREVIEDPGAVTGLGYNIADKIVNSGSITTGQTGAGASAIALISAIFSPEPEASGVDVGLSGSISGSSLFSGSLSIISAPIEFSGTLSGSSDFFGDISIDRTIIGSISGNSVLSGSIDIFSTVTLSGSLSGSSEFAGNLVKIYNLSGSLSGSSELSANISIDRTIVGSLTGSSIFTSSLSISGSGSFFNQKFEPPANRIIHGLGHLTGEEPESTEWLYQDAYTGSAGHKPVLLSTYMYMDRTWYDPNFSGDVWNNWDDALNNHGADFGMLVGITLFDTASYLNNFSPSNIDFTGLLAGDYDDSFAEMAATMSAYSDRPFFIRPMYEYQGSGGIHNVDNMNITNFKNAWNYIYNYFTLTASLDNIAFVWNCVNPETFDFEDWYPGDDKVDWWGVNLFASSDFNNAQNFFDSASAHGKPVFIGEAAPSLNGGSSNQSWYNSLFFTFDENPQIKAFVYLNEEFGTASFFDTWDDSRISEDPTTETLYASEMDKARYIHYSEYISDPTILNDFTQGENVLLSGSFSGSSILTAGLDVGRQLSGSFSGSSALTSILVLNKLLSGSLSGSSLFTSTLNAERIFSGSISGSSNLTSVLILNKPLSGAFSGSSLLTAGLDVGRQLSGSFSGSSLISSNISISRSLIGSTSGNSLITSVLNISRSLIGDIAGISTFSSNIDIIRSFSGSILSNSSLSGSLDSGRQLSGSISGSSLLVSQVDIGRMLSGSIQSVSNFNSILTVQGEVNLAGSINSIAVLNSSMSLELGLSGSISGSSIFISQLGVERNIIGSFSGSSIFLNSISIDRGLIGNLSGSSVISATPLLQLGIEGTISGSSNVSTLGELCLYSETPIWNIHCDVWDETDTIWSGVSTFIGSLNGNSFLSGSLELTKTLSGSILVTSQFNSGFSIERQLSGSFSGSSQLSGNLDVSAFSLLNGSINATSSFSGNLVRSIPVQGLFNGISQFSGSLVKDYLVNGSLSGNSEFSGSLILAKLLNGSLSGSSQLSGSLSGISTLLVGSIGGDSDFNGTLNGITEIPIRKRGGSRGGLTSQFGKPTYRKDVRNILIYIDGVKLEQSIELKDFKVETEDERIENKIYEVSIHDIIVE